jgi:hypothetical protein
MSLSARPISNLAYSKKVLLCHSLGSFVCVCVCVCSISLLLADLWGS